MLKIHQDVWSRVAKVKVSERNQERKKGTLWDLSRLANKYSIKYFSISREWMVRELIFPSALVPPRKILAPLSSKTASKSSLWVRSVVQEPWYRQWGAWTRPSMRTFGPHLCEVNWSPWRCQRLDMVPQHVQKASKKHPEIFFRQYPMKLYHHKWCYLQFQEPKNREAATLADDHKRYSAMTWWQYRYEHIPEMIQQTPNLTPNQPQWETNNSLAHFTCQKVATGTVEHWQRRGVIVF